jgi:hypothetical protein
VNLFVASTGTVALDGNTVRITQKTDYPWDGKVRIAVEPEKAGRFALCVRIPGWTEGRPVPSDLYRYVEAADQEYRLTLDGEPLESRSEKGYAVVEREWKPGEVVDLDLPMPVRRVLAHENVEADRGRVAIERGPVVYCVEGADHGGDVLNLVLPDDGELEPEPRPDLLGGVMVLRGSGTAAYRDEDGQVGTKPAQITMIPCYAWCHRGPNEMAVWLPRSVELARVPPPPTIASKSRATASHCWPADSCAALNDQIEPKNSIDHSIPRMTWWDHRGTSEWVQYDLREPTEVSAVEVYWFDDTGRGQCRVPASWRLVYREGNEWEPVETDGGFGTEKDRFNEARFKPVTTDGLRLEVELQPDVSGGILEWKVR